MIREYEQIARERGRGVSDNGASRSAEREPEPAWSELGAAVM